MNQDSRSNRNRLAAETSPYLLQHADNPVAWWPWGEDAFAEARRTGRPILLSVGYSACHWCHVMAHESFEDPATAAVMNELFVNIKVDREERPDVDAIYQSALAALGEQGGWPLTMFLDPQGRPFWGGTYFPPAPRFGRPAFSDLLRSISSTYWEQPEKVTENVAALQQALARLSPPPSAGEIRLPVLDQIAERLLREVDPDEGGIGGPPKFPQPSILELLWRAGLRLRDPRFRDAVLLTLRKMSLGGIYDHVGGGFARYSTDSRWLVPHFEKMLYDNAQLLDLLTHAWQATADPLFAARARETVAWLFREMSTEGGGFAASLDADSDGEEGRFYVWRASEVDALLGGESPGFKAAYDVTPGGNWEGVTILNRSADPTGDMALEHRYRSARQTLLAAREKRPRPARDDKVLADWNGLMVAALAKAGTVFAEPGWIERAVGAFNFVTHAMMSDDRLVHSHCLGRGQHPASLDDYANLCKAALALYEATGITRYLDQARRWIDVIDRHYLDADAGGYFFTADDTAGLILRTKTAADHAVPAGNGTIAQVLARLWLLTGDSAYRARAEAVLAAFSGELSRNFFPLSTLLNAAELLQRGLQVVIVGEIAGPLVLELHKHSLPDLVFIPVRDAARLPAGHPAQGKTVLPGTAAAFVCRGQSCSLPITEPAALAAELTAPTG